jgi:hypothetical protein
MIGAKPSTGIIEQHGTRLAHIISRVSTVQQHNHRRWTMKTILALLMATALSLPLATAIAADKETAPPRANVAVSGVISQMRSGLIFVRTPWGLRTLTPSSDLRDAKVGDEVLIFVDTNNMIVEAHKRVTLEASSK